MRDNYFVLHIGPEHLSKTLSRPPSKSDKEDSGKVQVKHDTQTQSSNREIKTILKDGLKQFIVTILIMVVGFFAINYQAYFSMIKNQIDMWLGTSTQSELANMVNKSVMQKVLSTDKTLVKQVKDVPDLAMEIMPSDMRLIIPRINQNIPVVRVPSENLIKRDWKALEKDMQEALKDGVVHYPGTSMPDQTGNTVITGHSSYFPWDPGRFKDVFALLHDVVVGDKIAMYYNQHKYIYKVSEIKVVKPADIDVLKQTPDKRLTLITCTPVGTNLKRLIVIAELVSEET